MVEKTLHISQYLGPYGAYLMSKDVPIYENYGWKVADNSRYLQSGQKTISLGQNVPQKNQTLKKKKIMSQIKKKLYMIGCKHPNGCFAFFRFCLTSLLTVVFGRFLKPKKCIISHFF